ncbi:hypothetical protein U1Q18_023308 [Sarracenia purpurea var. burkii]
MALFVVHHNDIVNYIRNVDPMTYNQMELPVDVCEATQSSLLGNCGVALNFVLFSTKHTNLADPNDNTTSGRSYDEEIFNNLDDLIDVEWGDDSEDEDVSAEGLDDLDISDYQSYNDEGEKKTSRIDLFGSFQPALVVVSAMVDTNLAPVQAMGEKEQEMGVVGVFPRWV